MKEVFKSDFSFINRNDGSRIPTFSSSAASGQTPNRLLISQKKRAFNSRDENSTFVSSSERFRLISAPLTSVTKIQYNIPPISMKCIRVYNPCKNIHLCPNDPPLPFSFYDERCLMHARDKTIPYKMSLFLLTKRTKIVQQKKMWRGKQN